MPSLQSSIVTDGVSDILASQYNTLRADMFALLTATSIEVTISSGSVAYSNGQSFYRIDTEGDAGTDNLDTISGGNEGDIIILILEAAGRVTTLKHGTGNIALGGGTDAAIASDGSITLVKTAGGDWLEIFRGMGSTAANLPSGVIALFDAACPDSWTRFSALDGKYPVGNVAYGGTGGAATHTHTYTQIYTHTHEGGTLELDSDGNHQHQVILKGAGANDGRKGNAAGAGNHTRYTEYAGAHTHTLSGDLGTTGDASGTVNAGDSNPPYLEMVYCKKD